MEKLEEQIHLRNIVSCLTEIGDYTHYLSYDRYLTDEDLQKVIFNNLTLAAHEASNLYAQGSKIEGLQYLAGLTNPKSFEGENYSLYCLLQNDLDYLTEQIKSACESYIPENENIPVYC